jgi:hypothetical protein
VGYEKGFFYKPEHGLFGLKANGRMQTRLTFETVDGKTETTGFAIPRARLKLKSHLGTKRVVGALQMDFSKLHLGLKDLYVDAEILPKKLVLRVGQFKRPFSRQQITSTGSMLMIERTPLDGYFGAGRDIGLMAHNKIKKSPRFEYAAGAFFGSTFSLPGTLGGEFTDDAGDFRTTEHAWQELQAEAGPALVGRVGVNHGDVKAYQETDFSGGGLRFGVATGGMFDAGLHEGGVPRAVGAVDAIAKAHHFTVNGAAFLGSTTQGERFDARPESLGAYLQAGYLLFDHVQPAIKVGRILSSAPEAGLQEYMVGINAYVLGDQLKWQTDAGTLIYDDGPVASASLVRTQLQGIF